MAAETAIRTMDEEQLRTGLKEAGLSQYEADAYLTVLERGGTPAVKIASQAGVPKSRIYDVLRDLEEDGYIETYEQDSLHARARNPANILENLQQRADRLTQTASEIEERWEKPGIKDHKITVVKRFDSVLDQFREVAKRADNQIQLAASPTQIKAVQSTLQNAIERGIFVKLCVTTGPLNAHEIEALEFETIATEARHRDLPAPFTALVDTSHTCFSPEMHPTDQYGILIDDFSLSYVFHWYFHSALWQTWELVYANSMDGQKSEYVDVRECICDIAPLLNDGTEIPVTVHGLNVETGEAITLSGEIVEIISAGSANSEGSLTLTQLAGQATLVLESDGREYGIGGRGATLEDIEATRIVIDYADSKMINL